MNFQSLFGVFARGFCMGIADLIPGVSGGTIAFISGIYQRLISAVAMFTQPTLWQLLLKRQWRQLWQTADATFLATLLLGILAAVALFSKLLHHWLETQPHLLLGFFFGLVVASVAAIWRRLPPPTALHVAIAIAATILTFSIVTVAAVTINSIGPLALFAGGAVAICAMLLPGISGSYILLVLGLYPAVISALNDRDILTLLIFAAGCGTGMLLFARVLAFLLRQYYRATMAVLLGVMLGALPKLWPWKEAGSGVKIILQPNVLPAEFAGDANVALVLLLGIAGIAAVLAIEWLHHRHKQHPRA